MLIVSEIIKATGGKLIQGNRNRRFKTISSDSRSINSGDLFVPLLGPKYDGHIFVEEAISKGAKGVITSKDIKTPKNIFVIKVKNTLRALQDIARFHRSRFNIPIIGVTGSSGKTTTKDMIASILATEKKVLKTNENYNNEIGVPLTLFKLDRKHKAAVIEMAMQNSGEIEELARIALPSIAVITNIGEAHLEMLKTRAAIAAAKSEIFKYLKKEEWAILPADDAYFKILKTRARNCKIITFGIKNKADITATDIINSSHNISFALHFDKHKFKITLPLPGRHNVYNALAAASVAKILNLKPASILEGLNRFKPSSRRMEIFVKNNMRIINDTYNANPSSMKAALEVLKDQGPVVGTIPPRRIAVIGDMLELGSKAVHFHQEIGLTAAKFDFNRLITIGNLAKYAAQAAIAAGMPKPKVCHFTAKNQAIQKLQKIIRPNDVILVKGSRGMKLEEIVESLS